MYRFFGGPTRPRKNTNPLVYGARVSFPDQDSKTVTQMAPGKIEMLDLFSVRRGIKAHPQTYLWQNTPTRR